MRSAGRAGAGSASGCGAPGPACRTRWPRSRSCSYLLGAPRLGRAVLLLWRTARERHEHVVESRPVQADVIDPDIDLVEPADGLRDHARVLAHRNAHRVVFDGRLIQAHR